MGEPLGSGVRAWAADLGVGTRVQALPQTPDCSLGLYTHK